MRSKVNNKINGLFDRISTILDFFTPSLIRKHPHAFITASTVLFCLFYTMSQAWITDLLSSKIHSYPIKATIWMIIPSVFIGIQLLAIQFIRAEMALSNRVALPKNLILVHLVFAYSVVHLITGIIAYPSQIIVGTVLIALFLPLIYYLIGLDSEAKTRVFYAISLGICYSAFLVILAGFLLEPLTKKAYTGIFMDPNGFSEFWGAALISAFFLISASPKKKVAFYLLVFFAFAMVFFSRSRTGLIITFIVTMTWIIAEASRVTDVLKGILKMLFGFILGVSLSYFIFISITYPINKEQNFLNQYYRQVKTDIVMYANQRFAENDVQIIIQNNNFNYEDEDIPSLEESLEMLLSRFDGFWSSIKYSIINKIPITDGIAAPNTNRINRNDLEEIGDSNQSGNHKYEESAELDQYFDSVNTENYSMQQFTSSRSKIWIAFIHRIKMFGQRKEYIDIPGYGQKSTNLAHNTYLQIANDVGGIALIFFIIINAHYLFDVAIKTINLKNKKNKQDKILLTYQMFIFIYFNLYGLLFSGNSLFGNISYLLFLMSLGLIESYRPKEALIERKYGLL